jgi:hypothetical protein
MQIQAFSLLIVFCVSEAVTVQQPKQAAAMMEVYGGVYKRQMSPKHSFGEFPKN